MKGKSICEFIAELYYNPEIEFMYNNKQYIVSGYVDSEDTIYSLEVCCIDDNRQIFLEENKSREYCVKSFEESCIFDGNTIYDIEKDITVLYS